MKAQLDTQRRRALQLGSAGTAALALGGFARTPAAFAQEASRQYGIEGQLAPEIKLDYWIDGQGEPGSFSVRNARGKWVFLKFFQNWCPGCHSSGFPTLKAVCDNFYGHDKMAIAAVQTVFEGYRSNTQDKVRELQLRYEIPAIMGHDAGSPDEHLPSLTMVNYRTGGTPWLVLINPQGVVVYNNFHVDRDKLVEYLRTALA